jgi:hypothetical protein
MDFYVVRTAAPSAERTPTSHHLSSEQNVMSSSLISLFEFRDSENLVQYILLHS